MNKENKGEPIQSNAPIEFSFNNFRRYLPNRQTEIFKIEFEVDEDTFIKLGGFPRDAIGTAAIFWTERSGWQEHEAEEKKTVKPKKKPAKREPHGPYSPYWNSLHKQAFFSYAPVLNLMRRLKNYAEETDKQILQRLFAVDTRSDIAPDEFRCWLYEQLVARDLDGFQRKDLARMFKVAEEKQGVVQSEVMNG